MNQCIFVTKISKQLPFDNAFGLKITTHGAIASFFRINDKLRIFYNLLQLSNTFNQKIYKNLNFLKSFVLYNNKIIKILNF